MPPEPLIPATFAVEPLADVELLDSGDGEKLERTLTDVPSVRHWVGQTGVRELAGFFSALAELGGVLVGCDSAPAHLASACGLSVVVLSGPQDPRRTGPWPVPTEPASTMPPCGQLRTGTPTAWASTKVRPNGSCSFGRWTNRSISR